MAPAAGDDNGLTYHNVVFIDTSLDTHLAMIVTDSDTVSDFKEKIMLEHRQLFPTIGDIKVECLKVKRRGSFYHLSDSMLVKNAFDVTKRNWFVSVDASRLEQNVGIQHSVKPKDGDQLALPWVTHSRSTERQDNHGSPSVHSKNILFVNQKVTNADQLTSGDSCKDVLKNVEEDRSNNVKQLNQELQEKLYTVDTGINSKKRTRDVHNESSLKDSFGSGPSAKKKRKTQRVKSNVKASEEDIVLAYDNEKVNDKNASINNEDSFEHKSKGNDSSDENNRTNKVENCSALDQVAVVVPSIEGVGSETVGDVAMVVENNVQQDMSIGISQKEKDSEPVQKPAMENEIHSSLTRTPDCEGDAAGVTATSHVKRIANHKAAEKEVASTQQDVGSHGQDCEGVQIDKYKDALEISLKQRPEISTTGKNTSQVNAQGISDNLEKQNEKMDDTTKKKKKRKSKKSAGRNEDELITKHAEGDISSTVLASVTDERKLDEVSEKTLIDAKKGDDVIGKEVDISVDNMEEISRKEFTDTNDVVTVTNVEHILPHSETMMNNDAEISTLGKDTSQVNAQVISDDLKKQNEKKDDKTKKKRKSKSKIPAGRNEDESITKHVDGDIFENVKEGDCSLPVADRKDCDKVKEKDAQNCHERLVGEANKNNMSQDLPSEQQFTEVELESKKSQSVDHHYLPENTLKNVTASEVSKANNKADISEDGSHELDFRDYFAPGHQPKKIASINNRKDVNKRKDNSRNARSQKVVSKNVNDKVSIDVLKDPNITNMDKVKTPKKTKKINAQNTNKQQSLSVQTHVKTVKNKSVTRSQQVKSLFNTPGTIFGDDSDDNATANTDSSTHTPSEKVSSSSSSGESFSSRYSRRNMSHAREGQEGAGKNNTNSQSTSKKTLMSDLLRRSSGFKKAKVTASSQVDDTESQPVDFVPDSQPMGN